MFWPSVQDSLKSTDILLHLIWLPLFPWMTALLMSFSTHWLCLTLSFPVSWPLFTPFYGLLQWPSYSSPSIHIQHSSRPNIALFIHKIYSKHHKWNNISLSECWKCSNYALFKTFVTLYFDLCVFTLLDTNLLENKIQIYFLFVSS